MKDKLKILARIIASMPKPIRPDVLLLCRIVLSVYYAIDVKLYYISGVIVAYLQRYYVLPYLIDDEDEIPEMIEYIYRGCSCTSLDGIPYYGVLRKSIYNEITSGKDFSVKDLNKLSKKVLKLDRRLILIRYLIKIIWIFEKKGEK